MKPGLLQSMGLQRVGHDWVTKLNWKMNKKELYIGDADNDTESTILAMKIVTFSWQSCCFIRASALYEF